MAEKFFISDTHFFHTNSLKFTDSDGKLIRGDRFHSAAEMNEYIVEEWNSIVRPQDRVYHLGDVAVGVPHQDEFTALMKRLNGRKRLFLGNHDHINQPAYRAFEYIELWSGGKFSPQNFVCSHIPLRPDQMRDGEYNVHGHTHQNLVSHWRNDGGGWGEDGRYINVCVEHTNYKPVRMDEIIATIKDRCI